MPSSCTDSSTAASRSLVTVTKGAIEIDYSSTAPYVANSKIGGLKLFVIPALSANNDIVWICGTATVPSTASLDTTTTAAAADTTVPIQYLPAACHP